MKKSAIIAVMFVLVASGSLALAEDKIEFEIATDFYSKYVWRGQQINDDYVFQTGLSAGYKGLTLNVWGNMDLTNYGGNNDEFTEWDYTIDYSGTIGEEGKVGYSLGLINYHFPSVIGDTTEFYWGFSFDVFLSPSITVYHDIDVVDGTYVNFGISHSFAEVAKLSENIAVGLDLGLSFGWGNDSYNNAYWGVDDSGLNDLLFTVGLPVDLGNGWAVTPSFNYSMIMDNDLRDSTSFNGDSDSFYTGVNISKSF